MPAIAHSHLKTNEPMLEHVNLMLDTFIAHADPEELRALVRSLLASSPSSVSGCFASIARLRLKHKLSKSGSPAIPSPPLFTNSQDGSSQPTESFEQLLRNARSLYGAGLGLMALQHLTPAVVQTKDLRWDEDDDLADSLAALDSDMAQAIQSSKEELMRECLDPNAATAIVGELRKRLSEASASVESWGGEFPFERTQASLQYWKL